MTVSGRNAIFGFGRQSDEGTALTVPKFELPMGGGGINPGRETAQLPWTNNSRDPLGHYVSLVRGDFGVDLPVLPVSIAGLLQAALGSLVTTGSGPYDHEAVPADALPWETFFFGVGGEYLTLSDAKVNRLVISGSAGGPLNARVEGMGKTIERTQPAAKWGAAGMVEDEDPFLRFIGAEILLTQDGTPATTEVHNIPNFELSIENNLDARQTDGIGYEYIAEGSRVVRISATDVIMEDFDFIKTTHFGSATGTSPATQPIYGAMKLTFTGSDEEASTVRSVEFDLPRLHWEGAEWPSADPGGAPITYALAGAGSKPNSGHVLAATVRNGSAGTVY
jgi:hypothetical protein